MQREVGDALRTAVLAAVLFAGLASPSHADPQSFVLASHESALLTLADAAEAPLASCVPATCAANGFDCGRTSDGCGGTLLCGSCGIFQSCGAVSPNVCGFTGVACVPGNTEDLSADGCACTGNPECEGVCPVGSPGSRICLGGNSVDALRCAPGNEFDYSADGCPCTSNNECQGVCPVGSPSERICLGADSPNALDCAPGNAFDYSANGCSCSGNSECQGVCLYGVYLCAGGDPADAICAPGNAFEISPNGCPCTLDDECQNLCVEGECAVPEPAVLAQAITAVAALAAWSGRRRRML